MDEEIIRSVAQEVGLTGKRSNCFVCFFGKRFPTESNDILSYVTEWAIRFKNDPIPYMDERSMVVYRECLKSGDDCGM